MGGMLALNRVPGSHESAPEIASVRGRTALMANRLELKRTPGDGLIGSSARAVAVPGTVVSLAHTTGESPGRTGMVRSSASHLVGATTGCHNRGGAKQLYGVDPSPR